MNKSTIQLKQQTLTSQDHKKTPNKKYSNNGTHSTQLPSITIKLHDKSFRTNPNERRVSHSPYQFVPKRLPEAQELFSKAFRDNSCGKEPQERTLINIKKQLLRIIEGKRREVTNLRNQEVRLKWEVERQAKKKRQIDFRKQDEDYLKFKEQQRKRFNLVLKRRRQSQNKFLQVGKRGIRDSPNLSSFTSSQFLRNDIDDLKSRLRNECINLMKQRDSFNSIYNRFSPNPQQVHPY